VQNVFFAYFYEILDCEIKLAKAEGKYTEGVSDLGGSSIRIDDASNVILKDPYHGQTLVSTKVFIDRGISYDRAAEILEKNKRHERDGFYLMKREMYGRAQVVLALSKPGSRSLFMLYRPNTGASLFEMEYDELRQKYTVCQSPSDAENAWKAVYDLTEKNCMHGENCQVKMAMGGLCSAGKRTVDCTVISGAVVSCWGELERVLERNARQFSRADRGMRTVRVVGSDKRKVIGLRYPASLLPHVKETIEMQWAEKFTDPSSLALLDGDGDENLNAILGVTVEAPTAIDPVSFAKCFRKTKTIVDFFGGVKAVTKTTNTKTMKTTKTKSSPVDLTATDDDGRSKKTKKSTNPFTIAASAAKTCCVCGLKFPATMLNNEINAHIDTCLADGEPL